MAVALQPLDGPDERTPFRQDPVDVDADHLVGVTRRDRQSEPGLPHGGDHAVVEDVSLTAGLDERDKLVSAGQGEHRRAAALELADAFAEQPVRLDHARLEGSERPVPLPT